MQKRVNGTLFALILMILESVLNVAVFVLYFCIFPDYTTINIEFIISTLQLIFVLKLVFFFPFYLLFYFFLFDDTSLAIGLLVHCIWFTLSAVFSLIFPWSIFFYSLGMFIVLVASAALAYWGSFLIMKKATRKVTHIA